MKTIFAVTAAVFLFVTPDAEAREISTKDLGDLPNAQVVFLGEVHDNPAHHNNQRTALEALHPKAVVYEMLTPEMAAKVTPEASLDENVLGELLNWADGGWPDFAMYFPLFKVTSGAEVYGAQVSRNAAREAVMGGDVAAVLGPDAADFGLTNALPEDQQAEREAKQLAAHCDALPVEMLPGMVLAQRLRDATLARAATEALAATGGPVAVITGNGHARTDWGTAALMPEGVTVLSVGQFEAAPEGAQPFDLWVVTEPAERDDPCAAFSK